jgi:hypothetical protein
MPAAAGRRRRRGTSGVAAGGSGARDAGGPHWGRLRRPAPVGKEQEVVGGWRATDAGAILEGGGCVSHR